MVFVLNKNKKPLEPVHPAVARKLLKSGRAVVHKIYPFTIRLKELVTTDVVPNYRLKIDYGSKHTGIAILKNNEVVFMAQIHHRTNIKSKLLDRRAFRRNRRNRKTRYRQVRFLNRRRKDGWLPPSLQSRVQNIKTIVNRLIKICPIGSISYENIKFDTQRLRNPNISGVEYQQGPLIGRKPKEYLIEKFGRRCSYCGKEHVRLEKEHIIPESRGGTDRIDNLRLACRECNLKKNDKTAKEFGYPEIQKQVKESLRNTAIVNSIRTAINNVLKSTGLPIEYGRGAITKLNRISIGLPKDHHFDAICVGESTPANIIFKTNTVLHITAKGRGSRQIAQLDKYGFPRQYRSRQKFYFGFMTNDMVKAKNKNGTYLGYVVCRKSGSFYIPINGKQVSVNYKNCKLVQRFDGYTYELKKLNLDKEVKL